MIKYKCLVLDHDDTVVDSTASIHFPCFVEYLSKYRPALADSYTTESYFIKNFDPGIVSLLRDEVGLSAEELAHEEEYWRDYVRSHLPRAYDGIKETCERFLSEGGILAVVSHSFTSYIERDYEHNGLPTPHRIYGWDSSPERRKPAPYALFDLMKTYKLDPCEILVVDDLKPGLEMARAAGVDFAAAGWGYDIPEIERAMRESCAHYLKTVKELELLLFGGTE